ncbi:MAG: cytochrome c [Methylovulum sp.]|uniref:c-type cytochrome n=1 Tax=Methylovulum sp. TaxID=1916980 RepID=UPI0026152819|nr:cytochrome c [Methylovulum sp.]MDD2722573.1 cytochrome c [Methylovulum sp.]MDD5123101.1 cytochrome c [Methylovulum sp.]
MTAPIPRDIPLPLPAPEGFLEILLIASFLLHIIFVHLMVGGSLFSLACQIKGLKAPDYEKLAYRIMQTVTVNKSLAVVMGVAPLLIINTLYAPQFYASSALIGDMWMAIIPMVTLAFLLAYLHKFWWHHFINLPELHIGIAALETGLFLFIPLIFMTNVNLMLFPEYWPEVKGFLSAMLLPNVLQRYLHFLSASVLFTALFFVGWTGRKRFQEEAGFNELKIITVRRFFYAYAFGAAIFQILTGLMALASLPTQGMGWNFILILTFGGALALPALWWMWRNLTQPSHLLDDDFKRIIACFACAAIFMGIARHEYRENALADHKTAISEKTANYQAAVKEAGEQARQTAKKPEGIVSAPGESAFNKNCAACHHATLPTVGPALQEIKTLYADNPSGIVVWTKAPGKKRADSMTMPGFPQLSDEELTAISQYILKH